MTPTPFAVVIACALAPVELRSGDVIDAPVEAVGPGGVTLGGMQGRVVAWDRVARVTGAKADEALGFRGLAVDAWRARSRLARGDERLAGPLFEKMYDSAELEGPTGLLIAEGTMRTRLPSSPRGAAAAWLDALALRAGGAKIDGEPVAEGVTDGVTGLVPTLPPIFLDGAPPEEAARLGTGDERADAFGVLYAAAMGAPITDFVRRSSADPAVEFVRLIVLAQRGDASERRAAREVLASQRGPGADGGAWRDAWRLGAIGRSLAMGEDEGERLEGVFALLEVAARWGSTQPHLSAVALHDAANALDSLGRGGEATIVREELARAYPNHPASRDGAPTSTDESQETS